MSKLSQLKKAFFKKKSANLTDKVHAIDVKTCKTPLFLQERVCTWLWKWRIKAVPFLFFGLRSTTSLNTVTR